MLAKKMMLSVMMAGHFVLWATGSESARIASDGFAPSGLIETMSPDGRNCIRIWSDPLSYEVVRDGVAVVARSGIGLKVDGAWLNSNGKCRCERRAIMGRIETPVYKKSGIDLAGNETLVGFGDWAIRLMARNDGVAYRFETMKPKDVRVDNERASIVIPDENASGAFYYGSAYGCEEVVPTSGRMGDVRTDADDRRFVYLPMTYAIGGRHVLVTESDVCDYPVWNLVRKGTGNGVMLESDFACWPKRTFRAVDGKDWFDLVKVPQGGRWIAVAEHCDYLVDTCGNRTYPWRTFILADSPSAFCESDIVSALARDGKPGYDFSWVKPGKVAWDWWNAWDNKGEKDGCNTTTYKRFIDFASKTGIEYVILDEGWSERLNIWKFHPNVDVQEIIRYGKEKNVGIILWMAWAQIKGEEDRIARHFASLGAKGFKVDFMDRGDAESERFLWRFADACAHSRMIVDYHGVHRPTGLSRAYPNVLNYEGVFGLEQMKFFKQQDMIDNDLKVFFLRVSAGPVDYTPGAMDNYQIGKYTRSVENPGSLGTRCRQMAMMVLFEAPLQMLCDSPSKYEKNEECLRFMAATPVVWVDTVGIGGTLDDFAAVARKAKDGTWYAAAINSKTSREIVIDTSFLGFGKWRAESFEDSHDADEHPTHYVHDVTREIEAGTKLNCRMAAGGGIVLKFTPLE